MKKLSLPDDLSGFPIHMIGIKGTGMAAFAELLLRRGAKISGSDVNEKFYTDEVLTELGIHYYESFSSHHIGDDVKLVIHSAAYTGDNPEMAEAKRRGIDILVYTEALGYVSSLSESFAISGVHGKTTTTALVGTIANEMGLESSTLVGSAVPSFGGRSTSHMGDRFFIAETCEYRRHFLSFHPNAMILTSIEEDHLDYFKDYDDILRAFCEFIDRLPLGGELIYCGDDKGACEAAKIMGGKRDDLILTPYGEGVDGPFRIESIETGEGVNNFHLAGFEQDFSLRLPGHHMVLDATAALAMNITIARIQGLSIDSVLIDKALRGMSMFAGTRRRNEIVGEGEGVLFIDDYGHHPTAIETTLAGLREFYPERRLVVDFMPHTYSRTITLMEPFSRCFSSADILLLHDIYSSAREGYRGDVTGLDLYNKIKNHHNNVIYCDAFEKAYDYALGNLREGDIFLTLGAGNNWQIGKRLYEAKKEK